MDTEKIADTHIDQIRKEYKRINTDWLLLHYRVSIGMVLFAWVVECLISFIVIRSDMLTTTVPRYLWKFMVVPSGLNFLCIAIDAVVVHAKRFSQNQKMYTVSLLLVLISGILFTAHNAFTSTYYIFTVAIILTTIYASFRVTCITAVASLSILIFSELLIQWDLDKISIFESTLRFGDFLVALFLLIACSVVCLVEIRYERKKNEASIQKELERQQLKQRLQVDELTGVLNRKSLHDALIEIEGNETDDDYLFAIADMDHFKGVNDQWGHHMGDRCLVEFAKILKQTCPAAETFRYGGDEFCILFHHTAMPDAVVTCGQIQQKMNALRFEDAPQLRLTASFGLAAYSAEMTGARLFIHADRALYEAKETRNAIRVFQPSTHAEE